MTFNLKEKH